MPALTAAIIAVTAASTITKWKSERDGAVGAERQGAYEKGMYDQNAKYAEQQAADAIQIGQETSYKQQAGVRSLVGSQRAALAAQGIEIDSGSALDVQLESIGLGEKDRLEILNNAAREAWGYKVQAQDYTNKGNLAFYAGKTQAQSLRNASWSTLLTGGAQIAGIYSDRASSSGTTQGRKDVGRYAQ